jgi:hypothetical protein
MKKLVFLLEEASMRELLKVLLPRFLPEGVEFQLVTHKGKQDLEKSIPRKLKAWQEPSLHFVVMRDQNSANCKELKQHLQELCQYRPDTLVRIVCHELEAWFLGDLSAVEKAFQIKGLARQQPSKKFRNPDHLNNAAEELSKLVKSYRKLSGARAIAPHIDLTHNCSCSFQVFVKGVQKIAQ